MRLCPINLLALSFVLCVTILFSGSYDLEILRQLDSPVVIVKTIYNNTPYDLLLIDRMLENSNIILPAGKIMEINFKPIEQDEAMRKYKEPFIVVKNMAKKAQYVVERLDQDGKSERSKRVYFDLHMIRMSESFSLNCYVVNTKGYCGRFTYTLNRYFPQIVEFELEVSINEKNVSSDRFELKIAPKLPCKRSTEVEQVLSSL